MLRFLHFEIGALDRQPRDELLSPFFEVFAETTYAVATWLPVFDPRKRRKFNEHRKDMHLSQRSEFDICAIVDCYQLRCFGV